MTVTYGGLPLSDPAGLAPELPPAWVLCDPAPLSWPGKNREAWAAAAPQHCVPACEMGQLVWPTGASRCAVYRGLATESQLADIRLLVYGKTNASYNALSLVMDDKRAGRKITTSLYLLPAFPLKQRSGANGLYAIQLVDARYFWYEVAASIVVTAGTTTWANLFTAIASALGVTLTPDTVSANYLKPDVTLTARYESVPQLLDAACLNVGHRFVRKLDGTCLTQSAATAKTSQDAQVSSWTSEAGGTLAFVAATKPNDLNALVPQQVTCVFPRQDVGVPNAAPYTVTKTLAGLALAEFSGAVGHAGTKFIHDVAVAYYDGSAVLQNGTELSNLAGQIATDSYRWRLSRLVATFAGIDPYTPEGLSDRILWTSHGDECSTRLARGAWEDRLEEQNHLGATYGSESKCCGTATATSSSGTQTTYVTSELVTSVEDTATATATVTNVYQHTTTGTPTTDFGIQQQYQLESTTTPNRIVGTYTYTWATATDATRKPKVTSSLYDNTATEKPYSETQLDTGYYPVTTLGGGPPVTGQTVTVVPPTGGYVPLTVTTGSTPSVYAFQVTNSALVPQVYIDQNFRTVFVPSTTTAASVNIPSGTAPSAPVTGDMWLTGGHLYVYDGSTAQQLDQQTSTSGIVFVGTPTTNVSNTTVKTSIAGAAITGSKTTASSYWATGKVVRVTAGGVLSLAGRTVTWTFEDTANSKTFATVAAGVNTVTTVGWQVDLLLTYSGGTVYAEGTLTVDEADASSGSGGFSYRFRSSVAPSTNAQTLDLMVQISAGATASDTITQNVCVVELVA